MFVKICGLTTPQQIDWAIELGYSAIGLVVYPKSKRYVNPLEFRQLNAYAKNRQMKTVAVSVNYADVAAVENDADYIQFYSGSGYEHLSPEHIILSGNQPPKEMNCAYFLYDVSHGSGEFKGFPEEIKQIQDKLIIAGGLSPENVSDVIQQFQPAGVDVSSGVESSLGIKSYDKMKIFIENCKQQ